MTVEEVADVGEFIGDPTHRGCTDRVEMPDDVIQLAEKSAITFNRHSMSHRSEDDRMRLEFAATFVCGGDQVDKEVGQSLGSLSSEADSALSRKAAAE